MEYFVEKLNMTTVLTFFGLEVKSGNCHVGGGGGVCLSAEILDRNVSCQY